MTDGDTPTRLPHLAGRIGPEDYADSFAAVRELVATMFELDTPTPEGRLTYAQEFALYDYGPIKLNSSRGPAAIMRRGSQLIASSGVDQFHVQVYRSGGYVMTIDGAQTRVEAGDVGLLDLSRPVDLDIDGIDNLAAIVERNLLEPLLADVADVHGLVLRGDSEVGVAVREHLQEMWLQGPALSPAEGREWASATAALLAGVIRANSQSLATTRAELRRSQLRAIRRRIDRDLGDPRLNAVVLAGQFHVTRPTLYRMFEPHGGIGRYILGKRLTGVYRDLSDPAFSQEPIAPLLRRWGFENHTAAGRAFRAAYGMTPTRCRARAAAEHRAGAARTTFDVPAQIPANVAAFKGRSGA